MLLQPENRGEQAPEAIQGWLQYVYSPPEKPNILPTIQCPWVHSSPHYLRPIEVPQVDKHIQIDADFFRSLDWSDLWRDARMEEVIHYLRTSKYCTVPSSIDVHIPWEMFQPEG